MADKPKEKDEVQPVKIAPVDEGTIAGDTTASEQTNEVAVRTPLAVGQATGEIDASDIKYPTLRIIQKMSDNPEKLDEGTITLDNSMVIGDENGVVRMTVVSIDKYFKEVLAFGAGIPQTFPTAEAASREGFLVARSREDRASGRPLVEDAARALVLVEQPEGAMDRSYPYVLDGLRMAPAIWFIQATAYREVAKTIFSKLNFELRTVGLLPAVWRLTTSEVTGAKGVYYVPKFSLLNEERTPQFVEDLKAQVTV